MGGTGSVRGPPSSHHRRGPLQTYSAPRKPNTLSRPGPGTPRATGSPRTHWQPAGWLGGGGYGIDRSYGRLRLGRPPGL